MAWTSVVLPVPSSPDSPITTGARSWAPTSSPNRLSSLADRRICRLEFEELIAQDGRQFEVELFGGGLHLLLEHPNQRVALARVGGPLDHTRFGPPRTCVGHTRHEPDVEHRLHDRPRRDPVLGVVGDLGFAAAIH